MNSFDIACGYINTWMFVYTLYYEMSVLCIVSQKYLLFQEGTVIGLWNEYFVIEKLFCVACFTMREKWLLHWIWLQTQSTFHQNPAEQRIMPIYKMHSFINLNDVFINKIGVLSLMVSIDTCSINHDHIL